MKIQIASDFHFEIWKRDLPDPEQQFAPDETRDLLILAGDITDGDRQFVSGRRRRLRAYNAWAHLPHHQTHKP